jgi:hypothetical protein
MFFSSSIGNENPQSFSYSTSLNLGAMIPIGGKATK